MKKILITGAKSYIGTSFEKYINENYPEDYIVDTIDMLDGSWREKSFAGYDSVFHVAGIAHQKETKRNSKMYYAVNRDLAIETAEKSKFEGVKQFIFLSSMSVYGMDTGIITRNTVPNPISNYGKSKLEAEHKISTLVDKNFKVCILRPPMVYGKECKGNFTKIKRLVEKSPIFPYVRNERSMVYIDNLSAFVKMCVDKKMFGIFYPQNEDYVSTMDLVRGISAGINKKIYFEYISGIVILLIRPFIPMLRKAFSTLVYDINDDLNYCVISKMESIERSV